MNDTLYIRIYFQSYSDYFWQWEEDGEIVSVPNGNTIAYRAYLVELLEKLSLQGVPLFGVLLLTLVTTTKNSGDTLEQIIRILEKHRLPQKKDTEKAIYFLTNVLANVPESFKSDKKRIQLLQVLLEGSYKHSSRKKSKELVQSLKDKVLTNSPAKSDLSFVFENEMKALSQIADKFPTVDTILEALSDIPPTESEIKLQPQEQQSLYLESLIMSKQLFHVGALIEFVWAGLKVPKQSRMLGEHPVGGFADLSNKGSFDKLLVSEFANDDILFLSRLANNEALFIKRESPPATSNNKRIILIDTSIKTWGTPKAVALAVALAIAFHPKSEQETKILMIGDEYKEIAYKKIEQLIDAQNLLSLSLDASNGLESFFQNQNISQKDELFFLSSKAALVSESLQKHLQNVNYIISVEDEEESAAVHLSKKDLGSKKHLQTFYVPIQKLWNKNRPKLKKQIKGEFFNVILKKSGENKIEVIKLLRTFINKNIKEVKDMVEHPPAIIKENIDLKEAHQIRQQFSDVGALVSIKIIEEKKNIPRFDYTILFHEPTRTLASSVFEDEKGYMLCYITKEKALMSARLERQYRVGRGWEFLSEYIPYKQGGFALGQTQNNELILLLYNRHNKELTLTNLNNQKSISTILNDIIGNSDETFFHVHDKQFFTSTHKKSFLMIDWIEGDKIDVVEISEKYDEMRAEYDGLKKKLLAVYPYRSKVHLKNISQVFITINKKLIFSKHALSINSSNVIKLKLVDVKKIEVERRIVAKQINKHEFAFEDGSKIYINRSGMLILKSSDDMIPVLFIPAVLDAHLGLATDSGIFAGNEYYLHKNKIHESITARSFWQKYINSFIEHIVDNSGV